MNVPMFNSLHVLRPAVIAVLLPLGLAISCTAQQSDYDAARPSETAGQYTSASADPASTVQPAGNGYVRYTAPENAFTVELPNGWQAYTHIDRSSGFGGTAWQIYASPDNQIVIRTPDRPPITYMNPNPQMGMYEGSTVGYGGPPVQRYVHGMYYAAGHAQRLAHVLGCTDGRFIDSKERPDLVQRAFQFAPPGTTSRLTQVTHGEVTLQCQQNGQSRVIIAHATTLGLWNGGWYANTGHMTAPAAQAEEAQRILKHLQQTHTPNQAWVNREAAVGQQQLAANERMRQQQARQQAAARASTPWSPGSPGSSTYSGAASDKAHESFINSIRGTQDLTDRYGDTVYGVESTSTYHWQDGQGNIVGTDIHDNPNPLEYEEMGTPPQR